jgi:hypothetical protein
MSQSTVLIVVYVLLYLPLLGYLYGRQRRWAGLLGWALLVGGLLLALGGAGDAFAWAGLLWTFVSASGGILIAMDLVEARYRRR